MVQEQICVTIRIKVASFNNLPIVIKVNHHRAIQIRHHYANEERIAV
jgi:hypothetical protein